MDGLFNYFLGKGRRNNFWEKKLVPQLGIEPLPFACEASAITTEPSWPVVVEVTRMPIYNNALGSVSTQYFLLFLNTWSQLLFLSFSFLFSFYLLPPFFSYCFVEFTFFLFFFLFFFFSSYFFLHRLSLPFYSFFFPIIFFPSFFYSLVL